jgi:hypothetical protein
MSRKFPAIYVTEQSSGLRLGIGPDKLACRDQQRRIQDLILGGRNRTIHAPLTSAASVKTDLKLAIDGGDSAPAAPHTIRDLGQTHFTLTKQHYYPVQFTLGKILTLRPDHPASIPSTTSNSSNTIGIVVSRN